MQSPLWRVAVAVRSTDRYAPSAGMRTVTWSWASRRSAGGPGAAVSGRPVLATPALAALALAVPVLAVLAPSASSSPAAPVTAVLVADVVASSLTFVLPHRQASARPGSA